MLGIKLFLILPLIVTVRSQAGGIGYYGTSNVRTQGLNLPSINRPRPLAYPGTQSLPTGAAQSGAIGSPRPPYIPPYRPLPPRTVAPMILPAPTSPPFVPTSEAASVPQQQSDPQPEPVPQPETITEPQMPKLTAESDVYLQPQPIPSLEQISDTTTQSESITEPELNLQPEPLPDLVPELHPQPEPLPNPVPELHPQPEPLPNPFPELHQQPEPLPNLVPELHPQPEPLSDPVPELHPQPEMLPNPVPELHPQPKPLSDPVPELHSQTEPLSDPVAEMNQQTVPYTQLIPDSYPQSLPNPQTIPKPSGVALLPLLPKPKPERPPAFIRPTYSPYPSEGTNDYPPTTLEPQPTTEILPPVTTAPPMTSTYKPMHGGILESGFDCNFGNKYYAIKGYCDQYIECKQDIAVRHFCPDGLNFNPAAKWLQYPCVYPSEVRCEAGSQKQKPEPTGECPRQYGYFAMQDSECSKYVMCQEGKATVMDCPYGLVFNEETISCDWPENVPLCNPYAFKGFECPEPHIDRDGKISNYIYKYRYGAQCKLYVACQRGHPRLLSCDPGLLFHEPSQACIDEEFVTDCSTPYVQYR